MAENIYLFYGNDEYLVATRARECVRSLCPEAEESLVLETIDGDVAKIDDALSALHTCISAFRTVGLFGGKKVVFFRNASFFKNLVIMKNQQIKNLLGELVSDIKAGLATDQFLVISAPGLDKRSALFKAINTAGKVSEFSIPERDYEARPMALRRATDALKKEGFQIDPDALELFIDRAGFETRQILNEVEKIILYKRDEKKITRKDVQLITSPSSEAISWDFTDAVAERNLPEAIRLFRQLLFQKQSAVGLMVQLGTLFNHLVRFREYIDAGWILLQGNRIQWSNDPALDDYFANMPDDPRKMHWFRSSKIAHQANRFSARALVARKKLIADTHEQMISEGNLPHNLVFETLLAKLCASPSPRKQKYR